MVIIREVMMRREAAGGICCMGVRLVGDSRKLLPRVGRINQWYIAPVVYYTLESSTILCTIKLPDTLMTRKKF